MSRRKSKRWDDLWRESFKSNKKEEKKEKVIPLGRCKCGSGNFKLYLENSLIIRECKSCEERKNEKELLEILDSYK